MPPAAFGMLLGEPQPLGNTLSSSHKAAAGFYRAEGRSCPGVGAGASLREMLELLPPSQAGFIPVCHPLGETPSLEPSQDGPAWREAHFGVGFPPCQILLSLWPGGISLLSLLSLLSLWSLSRGSKAPRA